MSEKAPLSDRHPRPRLGKTRKDRANGHIPYRKNTKPPGERGHRSRNAAVSKGSKKK